MVLLLCARCLPACWLRWSKRAPAICGYARRWVNVSARSPRQLRLFTHTARLFTHTQRSNPQTCDHTVCVSATSTSARELHALSAGLQAARTSPKWPARQVTTFALLVVKVRFSVLTHTPFTVIGATECRSVQRSIPLHRSLHSAVNPSRLPLSLDAGLRHCGFPPVPVAVALRVHVHDRFWSTASKG